MTCVGCGGDRFRRLPFHYEWEGHRFSGWRCRTCGLATIEPKPTDGQLARMYGADYFRHGLHGLDRAGRDYETLSDEQWDGWRRFLEEDIRPRHPGAASIFEIGPAMGHLLAVAREMGWRVGGVEISAAAADRAREKFGLDLIVGDIAAVDLEDQWGRWDVVYAGDVLEHMRDPARTLERMARLLAPGGLAVVRVPTTLDLLSSRVGEVVLRLAGRDVRLPDPPYHMYEFTRSSALRLMSRFFHGVEARVEIVPLRRLNLKDRSPLYLAKAMAHAVNVPVTRLTGRWGDRLTVYCRGPVPVTAAPPAR